MEFSTPDMKRKVLKGQITMEFETMAYAISSYNQNFHYFAAYFIDEEPTVTQLHEACGELLWYSMENAMKGLFANAALSLLDEDMKMDELNELYEKVKEETIKDVISEGHDQIPQGIAATLKATSSMELYDTVSTKSGPFSKYMAENE